MPAPEIVHQLVKQRMELHKQLSTRTPQDKERVNREIEKTDKTVVNRLVYELPHKGMIYGLSEDEIGIMEEK